MTFLHNQLETHSLLPLMTNCLKIVELKRTQDLDCALNGAKAASFIFVHTGLESCPGNNCEVRCKTKSKRMVALIRQ